MPPPRTGPLRHALLLPIGLVAFCFAVGVLTRGVNDTFAVFVPTIEHDFPGQRAAITSIYGIAMLAMGFAGPVTGLVVDRLGPRVLALFGLAAAAGATLLAAYATELWHLYVALGGGFGVACAALGGVFQAAVLGRWFSARLGTALAIVWSANGVGVMLMAPLAEALIAARDWRFAYLVLAGLIAALVPMALVLPWQRIAAGSESWQHLRARAASANDRGPTLRQALGAWPFWNLALSFGVTSVAIYAIAPQLIAYLLSRGFEAAEAARVLAITSVLMPLGMIGFNWLADRGGRTFAAGAAYLCTALGVVGLWLCESPDDLLPLAAFVLLYGSTMGSRGPMISTLATLRYRGAHLGRIYGLITTGMGIGGGLGAWLGGVAHDLTGGYGAVMLLSIASLALGAATLVWEARQHRR